jgi:RNA polymerase sigma factor (TIGR02999 family)
VTEENTSDITQLLRAWSEGDPKALESLTPRVYQELRRLARSFLRNERAGHTLQTNDLVHEAYLRLVGVHNLEWQHRAHFYSVAAMLMRRILVDRARQSLAAKRGGRPVRVELDEALDIAVIRDRDLVAVDEALTALAQKDARKARVVELRYFGGLTVQETAEVMKVSQETVLRDWKFAKAWLLAEIQPSSK